MWKALLDSPARDCGSDDADWWRHHRLLLRVLAAHLPAVVVLGLVVGEVAGVVLVSVAAGKTRGHRDRGTAAAGAGRAEPREVDLSVTQRRGLHVLARLAQRHGIIVTLTARATGGVVCTLWLPAALFEPVPDTRPTGVPEAATAVLAVGAGPDPVTTGIPLPDPPLDAEPTAALPLPTPSGDGPADQEDDDPGRAAAQPADEPPPLPVRIPARGGLLTTTAPLGALPGDPHPGGDPRQQPRLGSTGSWAGWWDAPGDRPSPVSATAPTSTGHRPAARGTGEHPAPAPRPWQSVAVPPASRRPELPAAPTACLDPPPVGERDPGTVAGLSRRVPRANITPRLRVPPSTFEPSPVLPPAQAAEAVTALSRYQASRQAAGAAMGATADARRDRADGDATPPVAVRAAGTPPDGCDPSRPDESVTGQDADRSPAGRAADGVTPGAAGADRSTADDTPQKPADPPPPAAVPDTARPEPAPPDVRRPADIPRSGADPKGDPTAGPVPDENSPMDPDSTTPARPVGPR